MKLILISEYLKLAKRRFLDWLDRFEVRLIDKRLRSRGEERAVTLVDFDDLPVLYDLEDITTLPFWGDWEQDSYMDLTDE